MRRQFANSEEIKSHLLVIREVFQVTVVLHVHM